MYRVITEPSALADIASHYAYLKEHAHTPAYPDEWFASIQDAVLGLADFPRSFARAPENREFEEVIRHRIVGSYRILFTVHNDAVHVLHIRHGRQNVLRPDTAE
ncbi:MAG TPA: type II toxin-antitoxin system RelE/ParE family toxin [Longimicrobium sp.]|nr:type II toxin-antitoxin system RelE/ParE family toxin [Longimicrobium sp.]